MWFIYSFHDNIQFKRFFNITFSGIFNSKNYSIIFFLENSIQKLIQNFWFGSIQLNRIFIQFENQGIGHLYLNAILGHSLITSQPEYYDSCSFKISKLAWSPTWWGAVRRGRRRPWSAPCPCSCLRCSTCAFGEQLEKSIHI